MRFTFCNCIVLVHNGHVCQSHRIRNLASKRNHWIRKPIEDVQVFFLALESIHRYYSINKSLVVTGHRLERIYWITFVESSVLFRSDVWSTNANILDFVCSFFRFLFFHSINSICVRIISIDFRSIFARWTRWFGSYSWLHSGSNPWIQCSCIEERTNHSRTCCRCQTHRPPRSRPSCTNCTPQSRLRTYVTIR